MDSVPTPGGLAPFSLKDAPALIERVFPAQKVGVEAQSERNAGPGQTLTSLGSYWKGRKPLVLARACVLACLLPATDDPESDLELFEALMAMDDDGMRRRKPDIDAELVAGSRAVPEGEWRMLIDASDLRAAPQAKKQGKAQDGPRRWLGARWKPVDFPPNAGAEERREATRRTKEARAELCRRTFEAMPFGHKVWVCERAENVERISDPEDPFRAGVWDMVALRLGTMARTIPDLVAELGVARFGRRPIVCDPFSGGGSIPFEAARVGCDVVASDINPVACTLTWGALNVIGAAPEERARRLAEQHRIAADVDRRMQALGVEHDAEGNRAKAFLYCAEAVDPQTGWLVPLLPRLVVSEKRRMVARLVPDYGRKRFDIRIEQVETAEEVAAAKASGTIVGGEMVYHLASLPGGPDRRWSLPVARLRGDGNGADRGDGTRGNLLRLWENSDVAPRRPRWDPEAKPAQDGLSPGAWVGGDILLERLYCIQWMRAADIAAGRKRPDTFFAAPTEDDLAREARVEALVRNRLEEWQVRGFVPATTIEMGEKTEEPIRTRGWTRWHHFFFPRQLLMFATLRECGLDASMANLMAMALDYNNRAAEWQAHLNTVSHLFTNQALKVLWDPAARGSVMLLENLREDYPHFPVSGSARVACRLASEAEAPFDLAIFDPPYADAVHYHEITEFFIGWFSRSAPQPLDAFTWDSRRPMAIQGKGDKFRADMVTALRAMAKRMPDNGLQVCMFTHKDAGVWADLAQIVWGAGLQVTAAWYVSTETTSELKQGGYVQGTVLMVLRKRVGDEHGFRSDIVPEVRHRVAKQVETLTGLNQRVRGRGRDENVFSDADIQMAGYAAALEVLTAYTHIDGVDMTREALRPRDGKRSAEVGVVEEMITLAVQTANELMVPDGITEGMWERLSSEERFYLKMTATEATWPSGQTGGKLDDYQNFARVYRSTAWEDLMAEQAPNKARLKGAAEFKRALMVGHPFAAGTIRPTLYAIAEQARATAQEEDPRTSGDRILHGLRDHFGLEHWRQARDNVRALATWFGSTWERQRPEEAAAGRVLAGLIASERLAG